MGENGGGREHFSSMEVAIDVVQGGSKWHDEDGRLKRTGNMWTVSAHIITAIIGSGVLSLAWAIAQLGWATGPAVIILLAFVNYYTSVLLADCYRSGDPVTGKRNYTYMDAIRANLGGVKVKICGYFQYIGLFGMAIAYTIAASTSLLAIKRSNCFHEKGHSNPCHASSTHYMLVFGIIELVFSQIPNFEQIWWLSGVAAVMSFTYSSIGLLLGLIQVVANGTIKGSLTGISIGVVSHPDKIWRRLQALGDIAFAYNFTVILIEIQDTIRAPPPSEAKVMKKATLLSVGVTTIFNMLCGCLGYAAFGDKAPGNLLTGFGFYDPFWLLDIGNFAIFVHLVGAYQVFCQPLFAFIEKWARKTWPESKFITKDICVSLGSARTYNLNLFRLVWRSIFVMLTTTISMILPFFNDVVGLLGAFGFWPLSVYFPIEIYIAHKKVPRWSSKWLLLQMLSIGCLGLSLSAAAGSIVGIISDLKVYRPFKAGS